MVKINLGKALVAPYNTNRKADKMGKIPVLGVIIGGGRAAWGITKIAANLVPAFFRSESKEAVADGAKSIARGTFEAVPLIGWIVNEIFEPMKVYKVDEQKYKIYNSEMDDFSGGTFEGEVKYGRLQYGKLMLNNGDTYNGDFPKGYYLLNDVAVFCGEGEMHYQNGDVYNGNWLYGVREGNGVMTYDDHEVYAKYEGNWRKDRRSGTGKMEFKSGQSFDGEWRNDKRHGHGILTYNNGDVFEGEWAENSMNGPGTLTLANGDVHKGIWKNNLRHGKFTFTLSGGKELKHRYSFGELVEDLTKGPGVEEDGSGPEN